MSNIRLSCWARPTNAPRASVAAAACVTVALMLRLPSGFPQPADFWQLTELLPRQSEEPGAQSCSRKPGPFPIAVLKQAELSVE